MTLLIALFTFRVLRPGMDGSTLYYVLSNTFIYSQRGLYVYETNALYINYLRHKMTRSVK